MMGATSSDSKYQEVKHGLYKVSSLLGSREGVCALIGRLTVEWSPGARTRTLCDHNRVYGTAAA
jgi:hypothetical protein